MKSIKTILALLFVTIILGIDFYAYAQPNIPKEKIPADIHEDVKKEIERLYSSSSVERGKAARKLRGFRSGALKPAMPFLLGMLHDGANLKIIIDGNIPIANTSPGKEAAKTLGKIGEPAVEPLIAALKNKKSHVRKYAAVGLGIIKDPRAVEPLIALIDKELYSEVIEESVRALGAIPAPRVAEPLFSALKDEDSGVRAAAITGLVNIKDKRAFEPLIAKLNSKSFRPDDR